MLAANIDVVLLAAAWPDAINLRRLERAVALAWESGAMPLVVLTKADLCNDVEGALATVRARLIGIDVLALSTDTGVGLDTCARCLHPAQTAVLLGPSGTGKSTLLNALTGAKAMRTANVRSDGKGRHTTTHRQLFRLPNGALLIDTPGLRELHCGATKRVSMRRLTTLSRSRVCAASRTAATSRSQSARFVRPWSRAHWPSSAWRTGGSSVRSSRISRVARMRARALTGSGKRQTQVGRRELGSGRSIADRREVKLCEIARARSVVTGEGRVCQPPLSRALPRQDIA